MNNTVIANGTVAVVNVTLAAGATSAAIGVTGAAGSSAAGDAILLTTTGGTVTSGGGTPVVSSISCLPSTLSANSSATCTVNLSGPAPAAGALVTLTNSNTTLSVPGSVQVTGGAASGSFSVSTTTIPSLQSATITASYNGTSANTLVSLVTVAMVSSLSCNPASVGANASTTCTVTLNKAAPAGGALVTLTNSNNTLTVPGSVTVPSSATSATFNATTTTVSSNQSATITASYNSTSVSATVGLITGTVQVSSVACDTNIGPNATDRCTVALNQPAPAAGATISLTSSNVAVTLPSPVTIAAGATVANFNATTSGFRYNGSATITATYGSSTASTQVNLVTTVLVLSLACTPNGLGSNASATCTILLNTVAPAGGALVTLTNTNALLTVPVSAQVPAFSPAVTFTATSGTVASDQTSTITASYNGDSAINTTVSLRTSMAISSLSCSPSTVGANGSASCTVTLNKAAPSTGAVVMLTNTNNTLSVPGSVTVPPSATTVTFSATTANVTSDQSSIITASYNSTSASMTESLVAAATVQSLGCNPASVGSNGSTTCTVTLSKAAPAGGALVTLTNTNTKLTVPASVTVAASATTATFNATTTTISSSQSATITASYNSTSANATVSMTAGTVQVSSVVCDTNIGPNTTDRCSVGLNQPAPSGGVTVSLTSSNVAVTVPSPVTIAAGATVASFNATTSGFRYNGSATITATYGSSTATTQVNLVTTVLVLSLACAPNSMGSNASTTCTIALNMPAPSGGAAVTLASTNAVLTLPASVTVPGLALGATFTATSGAFATDQNATIRATYNGDSAISTTVNLTGTMTVSSLGCNPSSLGSNGSTTCTVTLSRSAPAGGALVTLTNTNNTLSVPGSVTVAAGATTATFNATTATISSNQSATITASYNGNSANTTVSLTTGTVQVSSVVCDTNIAPNTTDRCTVGLNQAAPAGGVTVNLTSSNVAVTVPSPVTIAAGATVASFNATTSGFRYNGSATITATYGSSTASTQVNLVTTVLVLSLSCAPNSMGSNASTTCTVALNMPAPSAGAVVTLASTNAVLTVPASVTVPGSALVATFTATTGAVGSDQNATIRTTYNGDSAISTTVNLTGTMMVSSLGCNPSSVGANGSTTCTVTLSKPAPAGGALVTLTNTNNTLSVPASVTVAAAATTATFNASTTTISSNQSATITASYNSTSANTTVNLTAGTVQVSSVVCDTNIGPNTTDRCTVGLNQAAPAGGVTVTLTSSNIAVTVPSPVTIAAGATVASFNATTSGFRYNGSVTITATYGSSTASTHVNLVTTVLVLSLACAPNSLSSNATTTCTIALNMPAPSGGAAVTLTNTNAVLTVPASVTVPGLALGATFTATSGTVSSSQSATIRATYNGDSAISTTISLAAAGTTDSGDGLAHLSRISCSPKSLTAGAGGICRLTMDQVKGAGRGTVQLWSSSPALKVPASVITRRGQSTVSFRFDTVDSTDTVTVTAKLGPDTISETLAIVPDHSRPIRVPGTRFVKYGTEVRFRVEAEERSAILSAAALPPGAYFDALAGEFWWTPDSTQVGAHEISFTARDATGAAANASVTVQVDAGVPVVTGVVNAASRSREAVCGPGAIAGVLGRWLSSADSASDSTGRSISLGGTKVWVNGVPAPVLAISGSEIDVLCPDAVAGSNLEFLVETDHGIAQPASIVASAAAPGIYSVDGSGKGEGFVVAEDGATPVMIQNDRQPSQSALAGDTVWIYASGIAEMADLSVSFNGREVKPGAVVPVAGHVGLFQIAVTIPGTSAGEPLTSLTVSGVATDGTRVRTNALSLAVEAAIE